MGIILRSAPSLPVLGSDVEMQRAFVVLVFKPKPNNDGNLHDAPIWLPPRVDYSDGVLSVEAASIPLSSIALATSTTMKVGR